MIRLLKFYVQRARERLVSGFANALTFVDFTTIFTCPFFVSRAQCAKGPARLDGRSSPQTVRATCGARLPWGFGRQLSILFQRGDASLEFFNAFWRLGQCFPNGRFIEDFQNV